MQCYVLTSHYMYYTQAVKSSPDYLVTDHAFIAVSIAYITGQEDVFNSVGKDLLEKAFKGYNGCIFAYGQTGEKIHWSKDDIKLGIFMTKKLIADRAFLPQLMFYDMVPWK